MNIADKKWVCDIINKRLESLLNTITGLREELDLRLKYIKKVNADFVGSNYNFTVTVADGDFINNPPILMFWAGSGSTVYEISRLSPSIFSATVIEFTNTENLTLTDSKLIIGYVNA